MPSRTIPAGNYNRRITLSQVVHTRGTSGSDKTTVQDFAKNVPSGFKANKGRESYDPTSNKLMVVEVATFTIRYRTDVTSETIITYGGKTWDVMTITEVGRKEALQIMAQSVE